MTYYYRLRLFGHIGRSSPREDHHRALAACIRQVPPDWKRPAGRPSHTWLSAIEADLGPLNFGLATAWRKATIRDEWRHIVDKATLQRSMIVRFVCYQTANTIIWKRMNRFWCQLASPRGKDMKGSTLVSRGLGHTIKAENRFGGLAGASFSTPLGRVAFLICTNWQHEG